MGLLSIKSRDITVNGNEIHYIYNGDGNRVAKIQGLDTTTYLIDDRNHTGYTQVLEEKTNNILTKVYTFGNDLISQSRRTEDEWQTSYYIYDGHGSVRHLTDPEGNITDEYDYEGFGILIRKTGDTPNEYLYCGESFDGGVGGYYLRARWYQEGLGSFYNYDIHPGMLLEPSSLHKYKYTDNNPINLVDYSGYMSLPEVSILTAIQGQLRKMKAVSVYLKYRTVRNKATIFRMVWEVTTGLWPRSWEKDKIEWEFDFNKATLKKIPFKLNLSCERGPGFNFGLFECNAISTELTWIPKFYTKYQPAFKFEYNLSKGFAAKPSFNINIGNFSHAISPDGITYKYEYNPGSLFNFSFDLSCNNKSTNKTPIELEFKGKMFGIPIPIKKRIWPFF